MLTSVWPVLSRQEGDLCTHARRKVTHRWDEAYPIVPSNPGHTGGDSHSRVTLMFHLLKEQPWVKHRHNS